MKTIQRSLFKKRLYSTEYGAGITKWYSAGLRARLSGVRFSIEAENFSPYHRVQTGSVAHPASIRWVPVVLSLGAKRPGREVEHSPPSSAEIGNGWSYTSTPTVCLHGVVLSLKKSTGTPLLY
jgi:hypothetical protein